MPDEQAPIILYGHAACPGVPPARHMLERAGAAYEYVNIRQDTEARARVRAINNGNESVPTLVFPDGSTLTEPSSGALQGKLRALGYDVPLMARLFADWQWWLIAAGVIFALLRGFGVL